MLYNDLVKEFVPKEPTAKHAVIFYHKDISRIYKKDWIDKCVRSIENQTFKNFDVIELSYGEKKTFLHNILGRKLNFTTHQRIHKPLPNHVHAMNFLLFYCFSDLKPVFESHYNVVFNTNLDDYYSKERFMSQIDFIANNRYDMVSSDFRYVEENENGIDTDNNTLIMSNRDVWKELNAGHNVICHPGVAYTKNFWRKYGPYEDAIPLEDLLLWQKSINKGARIGIVPQVLVHYRIHKNQIVAKERK